MNQEELRNRLIAIIGSGLSARAIADHTKLSYDVLAKFKQGKLYLLPVDADKLDKYLSLVKIPTEIWKCNLPSFLCCGAWKLRRIMTFFMNDYYIFGYHTRWHEFLYSCHDNNDYCLEQVVIFIIYCWCIVLKQQCISRVPSVFKQKQWLSGQADSN